MKRWFLSVIGIAVALCIVASAAMAQTTAEIVGQISQTSYTSYLNDLLYTHTGDNRGFGAQHDLAQANIVSQFNSFGLQTTLDPFLYGGSTYYNVVATLPGTTARSNEIFIVGAHYDSVSNPGADDNASGVAGVLEAARVLSQFKFEATLKFVAFDREEQGLYGSSAWVSEFGGADIRGMISLDMIAFNDPGSRHDTALLYGRSASDSVKTALANAINLYGGGITVSDLGQFDASDHAPFEWNGKPACLLIEGAMVTNNYSNPYYHTASDSVDTTNYIDYVYATRMTQSTVGYLADAATAVPEPSSLLLVAGSCLLLMRVLSNKQRKEP